jgi:hypothetical protein
VIVDTSLILSLFVHLFHFLLPSHTLLHSNFGNIYIGFFLIICNFAGRCLAWVQFLESRSYLAILDHSLNIYIYIYLYSIAIQLFVYSLLFLFLLSELIL